MCASTMEKISDQEKKELFENLEKGCSARVPLRWGVNPRIILLNPELNRAGYTFEQYYHDPRVMCEVQAHFYEYCHRVLSTVSDMPEELPEEWSLYVDNQNIYDAAYFGAPVEFRAGQVPATREFLTEDDAEDFLKRDFSRPLENPWIRERLEFHRQMCEVAESFEYLGRKGTVRPFSVGFDGPVTVATNLFGENIHFLLGDEPELAVKVMQVITDAVLIRNKALANLHSKWEKGACGGLADDSIQLIGVDTYEKYVLPLHAYWYEQTAVAGAKRGIHLCGDATRHFPMIHERLGVTAFDTGFPVDHGWLRKQLGDDVMISGGPEVAILQNGTPAACAKRTREILESGVKSGRRFCLREGNNLPPCVPLENLRAVYQACLEYGWHE